MTWARSFFAPRGESETLQPDFTPASQSILLNPKTTPRTDRDWEMLQTLDPDHPLRRKIEGKVAVKQAAMEQLSKGHEISTREAFDALWRQMNNHQSGNLLRQDLHAALSIQMVAPMSAQNTGNQANRHGLAAKPPSRPQKAHGAREAISHQSSERNPAASKRQHQKLKQTAERVADIRRGLETADASELAHRVNEAREVGAAYDLKDPAAIRQAERMGLQVEQQVSTEARSRLGGRASQTNDIERDLRGVQAKEDAEKARLNEAAMALTPVGLVRGLAHAMAGKSAGGR
ncbi:MAG: hypothetical protein EYC62_04240 [Alphaproteobacteria bacterium]|nr:MAG: hypothetical protein EYC62_04240 [Alphaproteobacteria bacterium]